MHLETLSTLDSLALTLRHLIYTAVKIANSPEPYVK